MMIAVIQPPCILYTLFRHFDKELEKTDISNTNQKKSNIIPPILHQSREFQLIPYFLS